MGAQGACDDLAVSFLMPRCQRGRPGKSKIARAARAAGHRAATLALGRIEATPVAVEQDRAETAPAAVATEEPSTTPPAAKAAAPAKKPVKIAHKQGPGRDARAQVLVAARAPGFGLFGLFH
jgi:hypothetical protein